jgi:3-hydroxymyristoyl/3-hydroxydecanoyl-(acyl carrier protein) dehydratase
MSERTINPKAVSNDISFRLNEKNIGLSDKDKHILRILAVLNENLSRTNSLHQDFLNGQNKTLQAISLGSALKSDTVISASAEKIVLTKSQLEEFGTGSISKCFGPDFAILDQRKSPRIPNGDLLMIDRVLSITGERGLLKSPASIVSEITIPNNSWFLKENDYPGVPLSILMEIALQPCGILSAYLGTSLVLPEENNRFRNLDGKISFFACPVLSGKTITNQSTFLDSFSSGGIHIQNYAFELSVDNSIFLAGESSFGYFTQAAMEQQTGLDNSEISTHDPFEETQQSQHKQNGYGSISLMNNGHQRKHLDLIDTLNFTENTGRYSNGIITGKKKLGGNEWFYENHFYQDPVMPGSLGLEVIMQGLWAYVKYRHLDINFTNPVVDFTCKNPFIWKYRGQVIPPNRLIRFEIHLKNKIASEISPLLTGDADFWVDGMRIYSFKNLSLTIREG